MTPGWNCNILSSRSSLPLALLLRSRGSIDAAADPGRGAIAIYGVYVSWFMAYLAKRGQAETGVVIPVTDAEAFIRGSAEAGVLRIIQ